MNDRSVEQVSLDFTEDFLADGRWIAHRTERGPVVKTGTWNVSSDQLCVAVNGEANRCRHVWLDVSSGKIAMSDIGSSFEDIIIMTVSSLAGIKQ